MADTRITALHDLTERSAVRENHLREELKYNTRLTLRATDRLQTLRDRLMDETRRRQARVPKHYRDEMVALLDAAVKEIVR